MEKTQEKGRLPRISRALSWVGIVASVLATAVLALPTWQHAWFGDSLRTDVTTYESWANPVLIDLGNGLTFLPLLAFLAASATAIVGALTLRWPWLAAMSTGTSVIAMSSMLLGWALRAGYDHVALPGLAALALAGCAFFAVLLLSTVAALRGAQSSAPSPAAAQVSP